MEQEIQKKYTDMPQDRKKEMAEWCWFNGTKSTEKGYRYAAR